MLNQVNSGNIHIVNNDQTEALLKKKIYNDITTNAVLGKYLYIFFYINIITN